MEATEEEKALFDKKPAKYLATKHKTIQEQKRVEWLKFMANKERETKEKINVTNKKDNDEKKSKERK